MKYYLITTYTCYCGEHMYHYMAVPEDRSIEEDEFMEQIYSMVAEDAYEWWDDSLKKNLKAIMMLILASAAMILRKSPRKNTSLMVERSKT